jgi:hypothetical protein
MAKEFLPTNPVSTKPPDFTTQAKQMIQFHNQSLCNRCPQTRADNRNVLIANWNGHSLHTSDSELTK